MAAQARRGVGAVEKWRSENEMEKGEGQGLGLIREPVSKMSNC
jgi:hypothetical protein